MEYTLTPIQKKLIEIAKERGYLIVEDFMAAYSSPFTRKAVIERFLAMKLIAHPINFKFNYIGEK